VNVRAAAKDLVRINEAPNETGFTSCRHDSTYRVVTSLELNEYGRFIKELGYNIQVTLRWKSASGQRWGQQIEGLREAKSPALFRGGAEINEGHGDYAAEACVPRHAPRRKRVARPPWPVQPLLSRGRAGPPAEGRGGRPRRTPWRGRFSCYAKGQP
jgi:hypothetical protein